MYCRSRSAVSLVWVLITVSFTRHQALAKVCGRIVPGLSKLKAGVDITKLDLLPISDFKENGFMNAIVDYTCTEGETTIIDDRTYDVPDQVEVMPETGGQQSSEVNIIKSESQIKNSLSVSVGIGVETGKVGFSASSSYSKMQEAITKRDRFVSQVYAVYGTSSVTLNPQVQLGKNAQTYISALPPTFEADPQAYYRFIQNFGTHYFTKGRLGGMFLVTAETDTLYFQDKNEQQVAASVKATFKSILSVETGVHNSNSKGVSEFREASTINAKFFGGQTNLASQGLDKWQPTIAKLPYFLSGSLRTISSLIRDEKKKAAMEVAVKNYLLRSKAIDLDRLAIIRQNFWLEGQSELSILQKQLQNLKKKSVFSQQEEMQLQDIEQQVRIPEWFTERTSFCFKSFTTNNEGQCNGRADNHKCAHPNRMTALYWDKTYLSDAGCRMSWKIAGSAHPTWFNAVKVVFRWYPKTSPCACGPVGVPFTLSALSGSWTQDYLDTTGPNYGECTMQWKIQVPTTAPVWARNIKFCLDFTCGKLRDCVLANRWTQPYVDPSSKYACGMSWGLKIH